MQMARVFYSTQNFKKAIQYYEKLEQNSPDWATSLFEASWAYFMLTNNSKALGNIHTLNAPYFEDEFFPESMLLKAVIYYKYCQYDRALESLEQAQKADPANWQSLYNIVVVAGLEMKRFERADAALSRLQEIHPEAPNLVQLREALDRAR